MIQLFKDVRIDWLANRRLFIAVSVLLMLAGLASAVGRYLTNGTPFNLGVDFKGGTVITAEFAKPVSAEAIRSALTGAGVGEAVIQPVTGKNQALIKLPRLETPAQPQTQAQPQGQANQGDANATGAAVAQVDPGGVKVREALKTFGAEVGQKDAFPADASGFKIISTDAVGAVAGAALRNQAIAVTLLALVGIMLYIALRFEWTYGAAAVIAVFHDVLVTLGIFSIFQWEISLTVIAALLTLVGFSVNDTIVTFDRIRENLRLRRRDSLYDITNDSINQTLSRTVITSGLVLLSVVALVIFGGEVLRGFSLALLIGIIFGTYSSIAIASPIMVWWQQRLEPTRLQPAAPVKSGGARPATSTAKSRGAQAKGAVSGVARGAR